MSFTTPLAKLDFDGAVPPYSLCPTFMLALWRTAAEVSGARGGELLTSRPNKIVDVVQNAITRSETRLRGDCHRNTAYSSIVRNDRAKFPSRD